MYGKQRPYELVFFLEAIVGFKIDCSKRCLPVVAVHDVGIEIYERHYLEHAAREERKSFSVVEVAVAAGTFEIELVVEEIESNPVLFICENSAVLVPPREGNVNVADVIELLFIFPFYVGIHGNDNAYVKFSCCGERLRKRADNFGKAACLNEWRALRRHE